MCLCPGDFWTSRQVPEVASAGLGSGCVQWRTAYSDWRHGQAVERELWGTPKPWPAHPMQRRQSLNTQGKPDLNPWQWSEWSEVLPEAKKSRVLGWDHKNTWIQSGQSELLLSVTGIGWDGWTSGGQLLLLHVENSYLRWFGHGSGMN